MNNFIKVWLSVFISLCYCYSVGKFVPKGIPRLFGVFPIVCLFLLLPLNFYSVHLGGTFAFFIAWLANFKLLLFAFGKGPLSSDPSISLGHFVAIACLPIKIKQNPPLDSCNKPQNTQNKSDTSPKSHSIDPNKENPPEKTHPNRPYKENPVLKRPRKGHKWPLNITIRSILTAMLIQLYDYSDKFHPWAKLCLYCFHIYLWLDITLALVAALAQAMLGLELEPQFNAPYLSTSLQDFWGKRWNIMVTSILRQAVYEPFLHVATHVIGHKWAPLPAILGTFVVSALMHELMFYYVSHVKPTWEITWFFLFHGVCLVVEIYLKKVVLYQKVRLPRLISGPLALGFLVVTSFWMFFPPLLRFKVDVRLLEEYTIFKDIFHALKF
ncbi:hypothetical protein CMV_016855 [Castanea mollissima]|uniref:Wax synthase domain-containing protein n=1 Tax=Castanea mollissima TaxID=60419 RepID=A0A8J4VR86_9ROSI|nr:hypothetical protein CMV_016855 [Castanea mollissima]